MPSQRKPRNCEICDRQYRPSYHEQRTCGRICGAKINARLAAAKPKSTQCAVQWRQCAACPAWLSHPRRIVCSRECGLRRGRQQFAAGWVSKAKPTTLPCADCGKDYTTKIAVNCGVCPPCQKRKRKARFGTSDRQRARQFGVKYEPIDRHKVYERDGWRCQLCGKPVLKDAKAPHPRSPSLDHVVPMSVGGDHVYANVQCAHFLCNSIKGHRGGNEQLALVG